MATGRPQGHTDTAAPKPASPDLWERAKAVSAIVSAIVIPLVLLIVGNGFTRGIKERELQDCF